MSGFSAFPADSECPERQINWLHLDPIKEDVSARSGRLQDVRRECVQGRCSPRRGSLGAAVPLSGFLLGCMYGLSHVRLSSGLPASWCREGPVVMPTLWEGVEVERVWAHGQRYHLVARHGDERACIQSLD